MIPIIDAAGFKTCYRFVKLWLPTYHPDLGGLVREVVS